MIYTRIDFLPTLPEKFILSADAIRHQANYTADISYGESFNTYAVNDEIDSFIRSFLDFDSYVRWQIITTDIPIHYDSGAAPFKFLYITDKGGENTKTRFWSKNENDPVEGGIVTSTDREVALQIDESVGRWHRIDVKTPHDVIGVTSERISLIIRPKI